MKVKAKDIQVGMMVDLECDPYADPEGDHPVYECELSLVCEVEHETPTCTLIHFDGSSVGFPPDHELTVMGRQINGFEKENPIA